MTNRKLLRSKESQCKYCNDEEVLTRECDKDVLLRGQSKEEKRTFDELKICHSLVLHRHFIYFIDFVM